MTTVLGTGALIAFLMYAGIQVVLHRGPTPYSPIRNAVSDYGVGPTAGLFRASGIANLVGAALLAGALAVTGPGWSWSPVLLLLAVAACRVGVVLFPTDLPGERRTTSGVLHMVFAIAQFAAARQVVADHHHEVAAAFQAPAWLAQALAVLSPIVTVSLVALVIALVIPPLRRVFGIAERVFLYAFALWCLLAALAAVLAR